MKQDQSMLDSDSTEIARLYGLRRRLVHWFDQPLGRLLQAAIASHLKTVLPSLFGNKILQLGRIGHMQLMDESVAPTRILLDLDPLNTDHAVRAHTHGLPFDARSIDIAILPHTLDFADDPHKILREIDRVLNPEGHVVITGFNPYSFWGLRHFFSRKQKKQVPWNARFFSTARIKDWMSLLGYEIQTTQLLFHRPPLMNQKIMQRLFFLEKLGTRIWPRIAAVYVVVAKKQVLGMTPIQPRWKSRKTFIRGLAEPAAKVIHPRVPQWRLHRDSQG